MRGTSKGAPLPPRSLPERDPGVLVIAGPVTCADVPGLCACVAALLEARGSRVVVCDVAAVGRPDAGTVGALARLQLTARRLGGRIRLRHASPELRELLSFLGLDEVVPTLVVEAGREAEEGEH